MEKNKINRKSNIGTKGKFLHKFQFPKQMRPVPKININENHKLSSDHLASPKMTAIITFLQFFDLLNYNIQFGVRKFIISRFKTHFFSLFSFFVESNHQNYKSVGLSNDDIRVSWPIRHMLKRVILIILYVICIIFV